MLKMRELEIDRNSQLGVAHGARVEFMGVPILYTPWMDFGLNRPAQIGFSRPRVRQHGQRRHGLYAAILLGHSPQSRRHAGTAHHSQAR